MSEELFPPTVRRIGQQELKDGDAWLQERRKNYPTRKNREERAEAKRRLKKSGAYTSGPETNRYKREYAQKIEECNGKARVVLAERPPSLMDRLLYASIHSTDSLVLEMLTFIRDSNWLASDPAAPAKE